MAGFGVVGDFSLAFVSTEEGSINESSTLLAGTLAVAWRGDLPPAIEASLAPFRAELEASYDGVTNCFELPTDDQDSRGTIQWSVD